MHSEYLNIEIHDCLWFNPSTIAYSNDDNSATVLKSTFQGTPPQPAWCRVACHNSDLSCKTSGRYTLLFPDLY